MNNLDCFFKNNCIDKCLMKLYDYPAGIFNKIMSKWCKCNDTSG